MNNLLSYYLHMSKLFNHILIVKYQKIMRNAFFYIFLSMLAVQVSISKVIKLNFYQVNFFKREFLNDIIVLRGENTFLFCLHILFKALAKLTLEMEYKMLQKNNEFCIAQF